MPLLLNLLPARFLLTLREWFDYKISHCVLSMPANMTSWSYSMTQWSYIMTHTGGGQAKAGGVDLLHGQGAAHIITRLSYYDNIPIHGQAAAHIVIL